jgi:hypothetical protein
VVSVTDPCVRILGFLHRRGYYNNIHIAVNTLCLYLVILTNVHVSLVIKKVVPVMSSVCPYACLHISVIL